MKKRGKVELALLFPYPGSLDHSTIICGCSKSVLIATHYRKNYPLVLAGSRRGSVSSTGNTRREVREDTPFTNVFATMLQQTGVTDRFADSTGVFTRKLLG